MFADLYCKIYVNTSLTKQELLQRIANFMNGHVFLRTVETDLMGIDIVVNEDNDSKLMFHDGGFIYVEIGRPLRVFPLAVPDVQVSKHPAPGVSS